MNSNTLELILSQANLNGLKPDVQSWLEAKKIKNSDLIFINLLKTDIHWNLFFKALMNTIEFRLSYSDSLKTLELITDLILMGHTEEIFQFNFDQQKWTHHLKSLRYPTTNDRDDELKKKLEKLPWPYGAKTKFERRGDRAGIELKLFITSEADLIKTISALERVKEQLREKS